MQFEVVISSEERPLYVSGWAAIAWLSVVGAERDVSNTILTEDMFSLSIIIVHDL